MLTGRRVIVTGGASGMGEGLVRAFPGLGAQVVAMDNNVETGRCVATRAGAHFVALDVCDSRSVEAAVAQAVALMGGLDVLIHCAGIAPGGPAASTSPATWERVMSVNATGTFLLNQAVFPYLSEGGGAILNFASAAGVQGYPGKAAYAASKGAVVAWTRTLAQEWGSLGISVNAIAPAIWTPMYDQTRAQMSAEQLAEHDRQMRQAVPLGGRLGDIDEHFVPVMAFLASTGARFITGQVLPVDGGILQMR